MYRQQDIEEILEQLRQGSQEVKTDDLFLDRGLELCQTAVTLVKKLDKQFFAKELKVVKIQDTSDGQPEEVPFDL